jgi:imidazolonepropionase-like amidohydrolase
VTHRPTLLWNVRLIAGDGSRPRDRMAVTLADGRIERIDGIGGEDPPAGAVNAAGRTLLPGLIDAHVHLSSDTDRSPGFGPPPFLHGEDPRPRELGYFILARAAAELLSAGITTVRDVGSYDDEGVAVRRAVELGLLDGPRVLSCGRIISATSPGGKIFGSMYREADGADEMRKAVREQIRTGASFIKVMATGARSVVREDPEPAQMTSEECGAIVDEAHRMGFRVAAHSEGLAGTRMAIEQGVDTIEHGLSLHREPELLTAMAERGQVLVPTLTTFHDLSERFVTCFAPVLVEQAKRQQDEAYRTLAAARAAGVTLAMGHDSGPPGANLIEAVRMVDGGLTAMEGITAATANAALALGLPDVGTIRPGAAADLVVVDGDPAADIGLLTERDRIWLVLVAGRPVAGRALAPTPLSHHD